MHPPYVSLKTKLGVIAIMLLLEAVVFGGCWGVVAFSNRSRPEPDLPPLASLTETSGTVVGFSSTQSRRRSYHAAIVVFTTTHGPQQIVTRSSYTWETLPFRQGDAVQVFYDRATPDVAWLKWEYERRVQHATAPRATAIADTVFTIGALGIVGLTLVASLVYVLTPMKAD